MKFGKHLDFHRIPEWVDYYLDYESLKIIIEEAKELNKDYFTGNDQETGKDDINLSISQEDKDEIPLKLEEAKETLNYNYNDSSKDLRITLLNDKTINNQSSSKIKRKSLLNQSKIQKANEFVEKYKESVNAVNEFYKSKYNEIANEFNNLIDNKNKMTNRSNVNSLRTSQIGNNNNQNQIHPTLQMQDKANNSERDEVGYAASWKRAFSDLYKITTWLHDYCTVNVIACQKILKKFSKAFSQINEINDMVVELNNLNEKSEFYKDKHVVNLRHNLKQVYSNIFTDNNKEKAKQELSQVLKSRRSIDYSMIYTMIGTLLSMVVLFIIITYIPSKLKVNFF